MLRNSLVAFFVAVLVLAFIRTADADTYTSKGIIVKNSTANALELEVSPVLKGFSKIKTTDNAICVMPEIKGSKIDYTIPGVPAEPYLSVPVTVPSPEGFKIVSVEIDGLATHAGNIAPVPDFEITNNEAVPVYKNTNNFNVGNNNPGPKDFVTMEYDGRAGFRYVAVLKIKTALAGNNSIFIPEKIKIRIVFDAPDKTVLSNNIPDNIKFSVNHHETKSFLIDDSKAFLKKNQEKILSSDNEFVKLKIEKEGVYVITASDLSSLGIDIPASEVKTIKLFGRGGKELSEVQQDGLNSTMGEQEIIVRTKNDGSLDKIYFYAAPANGFEYDGNSFIHYINNYSDNNYYLLGWGGSNGKRASGISQPAEAPVETPLVYTHRVFFEEELYNPYSYGSGRTWLGRNLMPATFTEQLHNLAESGNILYRFSVAHRSDNAGEFTITENNNILTTISLSSTKAKYLDAIRKSREAELSVNNIASRDRTVMNFSYKSSSGTSAISWFDWYEVHYPREFVPIDNELNFFTDDNWNGVYKFNINHFGSSEIIGFDVTESDNPLLVENKASTGGMFIFKQELEEGNPRRYFISSKFRSPSMEKISIAGLRNDLSGADFIIISPREFENSAIKFKNYREANSNLTAKVVFVDDIYKEFSSCIPDPTAIRDFLGFALTNWEEKPTYVCLWGDGHFDYKLISTKNKNFIPPYESEELSDELDATDSYTSDDYFVKLLGDDVRVDMAIGRITIGSDEEGAWIVDKIDHYEHESSGDSWRTMVTLVADDSPSGDSSSDSNRHTSDSEQLSRGYVSEDMQQRKIYMPEYPSENVPGGLRKPGVTEDLLEAVNVGGSLLLNWVGHGNPRVWAHEEILERSITIPKMVNMDKLFFLTAATCDYGRFDMADVRCGAEEMLLSKYGGAIGVFSSSRLVYAQQNSEINASFYTNMFSRDPETNEYLRLGDIMYNVKQEFTRSNDKKFYLLGDPTMRLLLPEYQVEIDSINGRYVGSGGDTVKLEALANVNIKGHIRKLMSDTRDDTFDGIAVITMLDGDESIVVEDVDGSNHYILRHGGALNRSSYLVESGMFQADFILPRDISFSEGLGRFYTYAYSDDDRFAKGATRSFRINGITSSAGDDKEGPEINIYLDSRDFLPGDIVRESPLLIVDLSDESGINTTGSGIGHRIEAWVDDDPQSIDLTASFVTSTENPREGSAEKILYNLEAGLHTVKVRAWDVYNNYSDAETYFRVSNDGTIIIGEIINYPNPFPETTTIRFQHNAEPPYMVEAGIYNSYGAKVRTLKHQLSTTHTSEIFWDGLDSESKMVSAGVYILELTITDLDGRRANKAARMMIMR